jgi:hypothetical protein
MCCTPCIVLGLAFIVSIILGGKILATVLDNPVLGSPGTSGFIHGGGESSIATVFNFLVVFKEPRA